MESPDKYGQLVFDDLVYIDHFVFWKLLSRMSVNTEGRVFYMTNQSTHSNFDHFILKVFVINLLADKKYSHFRPVLDAYIAELFSAARAYE